MIRIHPFRADLTGRDGACTIDVAGQIDEFARHDLAPIVDVAIDSFESVVVDLSRVDFIDSSGVTMCLDAQERSGARGTEFAIVSARSEVMAPFDILDARRRLSWTASGTGRR